MEIDIYIYVYIERDIDIYIYNHMCKMLLIHTHNVYILIYANYIKINLFLINTYNILK